MIYFICQEGTSFVKIGYTNGNPISRLRNIQVGSPINLELLFCIEGSRNDERVYHELFNRYKVNREWFNIPDHELILFMWQNESHIIYDDKASLCTVYYGAYKNIIERPFMFTRGNPLKLIHYPSIEELDCICDISGYVVYYIENNIICNYYLIKVNPENNQWNISKVYDLQIKIQNMDIKCDYWFHFENNLDDEDYYNPIEDSIEYGNNQLGLSEILLDIEELYNIYV